jgi:hypothetical protein
MYLTLFKVVGLIKMFIRQYFNINLGITGSEIGLVGDGVVNDATKLNVWIASLDANQQYDLVLGKGTYSLGTNVTIPSNVNVQFANGAKFKGTVGTETLTINGGIEAGCNSFIFENIIVAGTPKITEVYPEWFGAKGDGTTDDTSALQKAINFSSTVRTVLILKGKTVYNFTTLTFPDYLKLKGHSSNTSGVTTDHSVLRCITATPKAITVNSQYRSKAQISNILITTLEVNGQQGTTIGINCVLDVLYWGGGIDLYEVSIKGFGVGLRMSMCTSSKISGCNIKNNGKGIFIDSTGSTVTQSSSFGNLNVFERTTIHANNIGIVFNTDIGNVFNSCIIEDNYIALQGYSRGESWTTPQNHIFRDCWFEVNGYDVNNLNGRPWIVNSELDINYYATGTGSIPIGSFSFINSVDYLNFTQTIPESALIAGNTQWETYKIATEAYNKNLYSDSLLNVLWGKAEQIVFSLSSFFSGVRREIFKVSNKGTTAHISLNGISGSTTHTPSDTSSTKKHTITYSELTNAQPGSGTKNVISSMAIVSAVVTHTDGEIDTALFLVNDFSFTKKLHIVSLGTPLIENASYLSSLTIGFNDFDAGGDGGTNKTKYFQISATGIKITSVGVKINFLPCGGLLNAPTS